MSKEKKKVDLRLYGVTIAKPEFRTLPFGHGCELFVGGIPAEYVDYPVGDIIKLSVAQNKFSELYNLCREQYLEINKVLKK